MIFNANGNGRKILPDQSAVQISIQKAQDFNKILHGTCK